MAHADLDLVLDTRNDFSHRHIGPDDADIRAMLSALGYESLEAFIDACVPAPIRTTTGLDVGSGASEASALRELGEMAGANAVWRSFIGMGYHGTLTPAVIQRNILENPGWYTQYTPYQAEIAQGRLEALLNFQTMITDLTGLSIANASLLDEATAAAEAMGMAFGAAGPRGGRVFWVDADCHPQTIAVVQTRAQPQGIEVRVAPHREFAVDGDTFGALVQYPSTWGRLDDFGPLADTLHAHKALLVVAADLLSLSVLRAPAEFGADVAVGSTQRFGVPMGFGGPHAAYFATRDEHKRRIPGRLVGMTRDADGHPAYRLTLQTREQHIRRERATSNICTSQVLLAIMASMYAVYHGPEGVSRIARRVMALTAALAEGLRHLRLPVADGPRFDTVCVDASADLEGILARARAHKINLRPGSAGRLAVSLDETVTERDVADLLAVFGGDRATELPSVVELARAADRGEAHPFARTSPILTHAIFNTHRSETELLRYIHGLQGRDLSLTHSMIPLGSCTMKLNATAEMLPITWPGFAQLHPFVPAEQAVGYARLFASLEAKLANITGLHSVSLQPNAGSQGEYTGLLVIRSYQRALGESERNVCLIPESAHGTNPASAAMAGMKVVVVKCDPHGNIDIEDLAAKADTHAATLSALMVTYPSTHGVFEEGIRQICAIVHARGGQVYMDGANMNAQVGLMRPGELGADVVHLNLHKTFCIPHGGGGPGVGPICVAEHLAPHLPGHPVVAMAPETPVGTVAAAPYGSPGILVIPWAYIRMMGGANLTRATQVAILNANYIAHRLGEHYPVLYRGQNGRVAHECILDLRPQKHDSGIDVMDVAKRLMDFGFHAPTVSFPVAGTLMVEPTESESLEELDRFCEAMIAIREEIRAVVDGRLDREDNPLKNAPHTDAAVTADVWTHPYSRQQAAWPLPWLRRHKFWPPVSRVDDAYGDRHLMCTCPAPGEWEALNS